MIMKISIDIIFKVSYKIDIRHSLRQVKGLCLFLSAALGSRVGRRAFSMSLGDGTEVPGTNLKEGKNFLEFYRSTNYRQ